MSKYGLSKDQVAKCDCSNCQRLESSCEFDIDHEQQRVLNNYKKLKTPVAVPDNVEMTPATVSKFVEGKKGGPRG
jgi:hypothetical protein